MRFGSIGKRPLGGRRRRWEDNTHMDLEEIEFKSVDLFNLINIVSIGGFFEIR
jgi:hypothetical protein